MAFPRKSLPVTESSHRGRAPRILRFMPALALLAVACGGESSPPPQDAPRPIRAVKVGDAQAFARNWFPGRARAVREVNVSFHVPGQILEFPVAVGAEVAEGQLLVSLDPRDYQNDLDVAKAQLERARAFRDRIEQAAQTGAVSQQEVTDARATFDVAKAHLGIREKALEDTRIVAPLSGVIAATYAERFQDVLAKQPVVRILDISRIEMQIDVPEGIVSLRPYVTDVVCRFEAFPGVEIPAEISEVGAEASPTTRTYPITLVMDQPEGVTILSGMAGEATGAVRPPDDLAMQGVEIPLTAVARDAAGGSMVWVLDPGSMTVSRRVIELGELTAHGVRATGIGVGEWIATAGANTLEEGRRVRLPESPR